MQGQGLNYFTIVGYDKNCKSEIIGIVKQLLSNNAETVIKWLSVKISFVLILLDSKPKTKTGFFSTESREWTRASSLLEAKAISSRPHFCEF